MKDSELIIKSFNSGDQKAYRILYDKLNTPLLMYAYSMQADVHEVEDIVQDAFIKLWEERERFDSLKAVKSFLYKVVKNSMLNAIKHNKVHEKHAPSILYITESQYDLENEIIMNEVYAQVYDVFEKLPTACKNIYFMSLSGYKHQEIADRLNISVHTVKKQKNRANKVLKEKLKNLFLLILSIR